MLIDSKNWFVKLKESKTLTVKLAGAIALSSTVGTGAYVGLKETVTLDLDGKKEVISTHADTIEELLAQQNIQVSEDDIVLPSKKTEIKDDLKVKIIFAKAVQLTVDGKSKMIASPAKDVKTFLDKQGIVIGSYDEVSPALETPLTKGMNITVNKAFQVPTNIGGKEQTVWSTSITVADFLKKQGVTLNEFDTVKPALGEVVKSGDAVNVVRVEKVSDVMEKTIPFETEQRKDSSLLKGKQQVVTDGVEGKQKETYLVTKENGKEVSRVLKSTETIKKAQTKVVAVGTKAPSSSFSSSSAPASSGQEFVVEATAYTPYDSYHITAIGIDIMANPSMKLISVDPRVIPLGSKVWVEGYGIAIAGDTGGAIKGNKIDVLVPNTSAAYSWGRKKVRVKILN